MVCRPRQPGICGRVYHPPRIGRGTLGIFSACSTSGRMFFPPDRTGRVRGRRIAEYSFPVFADLGLCRLSATRQSIGLAAFDAFDKLRSIHNILLNFVYRNPVCIACLSVPPLYAARLVATDGHLRRTCKYHAQHGCFSDVRSFGILHPAISPTGKGAGQSAWIAGIPGLGVPKAPAGAGYFSGTIWSVFLYGIPGLVGG